MTIKEYLEMQAKIKIQDANRILALVVSIVLDFFSVGLVVMFPKNMNAFFLSLFIIITGCVGFLIYNSIVHKRIKKLLEGMKDELSKVQ